MDDQILSMDSLKDGHIEFFSIYDLTEHHLECRDYVRKSCEENSCGFYGRNCMCPPNMPSVGSCSDKICEFSKLLIFKTTFQLEGPFDLDGMMDGNRAHQKIVRAVRDEFHKVHDGKSLALSAGACLYCERCAFEEGKECRFPDLSIPSLEAYCIDLVGFTKKNGIRYGCDEGKMAFFGMVLFN